VGRAARHESDTNRGQPAGGLRQKGGGVCSNKISRLTRRDDESSESGQALVEYALILMLVALLTLTALETIGGTVSQFLSDAAEAFGG
jgi:Flp pilus assembly pilin Flp